MDSTSLASAMFIMALAKNSTRMQILQMFDEMMVTELPMAEQNYFEAGLMCDGKRPLFSRHCKRDAFQLLSANARFESIRGLFNAELVADDTMTPIQREFIRLAQIFKSRLIVEMELKQRVMERAVIEERLGNREQELTEARDKEKQAKLIEAAAQTAVKGAQKATLIAASKLLEVMQGPKRRAHDVSRAADRASQVVAGVLRDLEPLLQIPQWSDISRANKTREEKLSLVRPLQDGESVGKRVIALLRELVTDPTIPVEDVVLWSQTGKNIPMTIDGSGNIFFRSLDPEIAFNANGEQARVGLRAKLRRLLRQASDIKLHLESYTLDSEHGESRRRADHLVGLLSSRLDGEGGEGEEIDNVVRIDECFKAYSAVADYKVRRLTNLYHEMNRTLGVLSRSETNFQLLYQDWLSITQRIDAELTASEREIAREAFELGGASFKTLLGAALDYEFAARDAEASRRPLDHKKFLDMLVDEMEDKFIELLEGTRAHTANIDAYIKRLMTALDDDFNTQFYYPTFRKVREASHLWDVQMGQVETTNVLANNRAFAKVSPEATMEFDLPKRNILIAEAMNGAKAMVQDFGALAQDPTFLAMAKMGSGAPTASPSAGAAGGLSTVRNVLPGLSTDTAEEVLGQQGPGGSQFGAAFESLIPDPAIYKFETGTGWEIRPVIQPDGQALVFHFNYMYSTNIREPVRADEKHLGRVKRHFVDTDVQLSNFELREISRYTVALKASRTARGVPLFEDIPLLGTLFRPLPSDESSLQQNIVLGQATIFPTLFDLMGLRWAPVVADLDPLRLSNDEFIVRGRRRALMNRVFDQSSGQVDEFLRIPDGERRMDLYRSQETIPSQHPNGYEGPGANLRDSQLQEGYRSNDRPQSQVIPGESREGSHYLRNRLETYRTVPSDGPRLQGHGTFEPNELPAPLYDSSRRSSSPVESNVTPAGFVHEVDAARNAVQPVQFDVWRSIQKSALRERRFRRLPTVEFR